jgi:hypothetical protein
VPSRATIERVADFDGRFGRFVLGAKVVVEGRSRFLPPRPLNAFFVVRGW